MSARLIGDDRKRRGRLALAVAVALAGGLLIAVTALPLGVTVGATDDRVRIAADEPSTLDPAVAGDTSAAFVIPQLFETLTAFDPDLNLQPALASSWQVSDDGRQVAFTLREGLTFSDGSPLTADDVVESWLRLIDPVSPSPLASLIEDVEGAASYRRGEIGREGVGIKAIDGRVEVDLARPASDFPSIVAGASFAVVPEVVRSGGASAIAPGRFVGSGAYILDSIGTDSINLKANPRYWAGKPAIDRVELVTTDGAHVPVPNFEDGTIDYAGLYTSDAAWIRYDDRLGPALRSVPSPTVTYYGFDTSRPPFDDVLVRRAVGAAVDWRRIADLTGGQGSEPATSMVPPGIPGRSSRDFVPAHDPDEGRRLLAEAGYPGGQGFPTIRLVTAGSGQDEAVALELREQLGIDVQLETMDWADYSIRLNEDPPAMWSLSWHADYPGRNDFLGILLGSGSSSNSGRWSSAEFDAAIDEAMSTSDPAAQAAAFDRAEEIVQRDVPVIPILYGEEWAIARDGLLGAIDNGMGGLRLAGLAWKP